MKHAARAFAVTVLLAGSANAADLDLPTQISWTAYANLANAQAVAIGDALEAVGVELAVETGYDDLAHADRLRKGEVDFSATAIGGSVAAQEGVFSYAAPDWGPQKVRLVLANTAQPVNYAIAVAGDLDVETYADLKGKRVAWYRDYPIVNVNSEAFLAYAGLGWDDVERVEVEGFFGAALEAMAAGELDAAFAATTGDYVEAAVEGPRGLFWPPIDTQDAAALARLEAVAPYFVPHAVTDGPGVHHSGHHGAHYPYPILVAMEATDADLVHGMTRALVELYPQYEGKALGIEGWRIDEQELLWFVPYHEGAVAYFEELGIWTEAAQRHNDGLIARQEALAAAWAAQQAENPEDWESAWHARRHEALEAGGFQQVF